MRSLFDLVFKALRTRCPECRAPRGTHHEWCVHARSPFTNPCSADNQTPRGGAAPSKDRTGG